MLRLLLLMLDAYTRGKAAWCWPAQATLATDMGCSRQAVSNAVNVLRNAGIIETKRAQNRQFAYRICEPEVLRRLRQTAEVPQGDLSSERTGHVSSVDNADSGDCQLGGQDMSAQLTGHVNSADTNPSRTPQEPLNALQRDRSDDSKLSLLISEQFAEVCGLPIGRIPRARTSDVWAFVRGKPSGFHEAAVWPSDAEPMDAERMVRDAFAVAKARMGGKPNAARVTNFVISVMTDAITAGTYPEVEGGGRQSFAEQAKADRAAKLDRIRAMRTGGAA